MKKKSRYSKGNRGLFAMREIKIAKQTLNMPDAMVGVMGGPNKKEAREILRKYGEL